MNDSTTTTAPAAAHSNEAEREVAELKQQINEMFAVMGEMNNKHAADSDKWVNALTVVATERNEAREQLDRAASELDHAGAPNDDDVTVAERVEMLADERDTARAQLAALEARYAADMDAFKSGAAAMAEQVKLLRVRALEAEAVRDSHKARITEIADAVKAERQCENDLHDGGGNDEWRRLQEARAHTDAMVSKHEGAGVSAPKVAELRGMLDALIDAVKADWIAASAYNASADTYTLHRWVETHKVACELIEQLAPEVAPDAARARDEG